LAKDHLPPHFHALYAQHEALIDLRDFRVIRGSKPQFISCQTVYEVYDPRRRVNSYVPALSQKLMESLPFEP
jgi:hypothetical protein